MPLVTNVPSQVMHEAFEDETVVVNMDRGHYFSFQGASAEIWNALANGASESELPALFSHVDGTALNRLMDLLGQEGLLLRDDLPNVQLSPQEWLAGTVLEHEIERFTDVEGLLLLDPIHEVDQAGWPLSKP